MTTKITLPLLATLFCTLFTFAQENTTLSSYAGREANASWRVKAKDRIERHRKGTMKVTVIDDLGKPIEGLDVIISMQKHKFGFGTAVDAKTFLENERYHNVVTSLFNEVVFENDLKWNMWYQPKNRELPKAALEEFNELGIPVRGHSLVWPSFKYNAGFVKQFENDDKGLRREINTHIRSITGEYSGKLVDWDVLNEPFDNHEFMDLMGYNEMVEWFSLAAKQDPKANLFINDHSILSKGGDDIAHQNDFFDKIQYIDDFGGKLNGIGMQGHFSSKLTAPDKLYEILERFATFKKDIKITEFDIKSIDENLQADYTRDFMTLVFSHPRVTSFLVWGFWEGKHWRGDAAMFRKNWNAKPNFEVFKKLVYSDWWTAPVKYKSVAAPKVVNGFLGTYELIAMHKGKVYKQLVDLNNPYLEKDVFFILNEYNRPDGSILVYPNMQKDVILVSGLEKNIKRDLSKVTLTDISGEIMHTQNILTVQRDSIVVNFSGASGMYILRLFDEKGHILYTTKFIKE